MIQPAAAGVRNRLELVVPAHRCRHLVGLAPLGLEPALGCAFRHPVDAERGVVGCVLRNAQPGRRARCHCRAVDLAPRDDAGLLEGAGHGRRPSPALHRVGILRRRPQLRDLAPQPLGGQTPTLNGEIRGPFP